MNGHVMSSETSRDSRLAAKRRYYKKHAPEIRAKQRLYRAENRDRINGWLREYYKNNKGTWLKARVRRYGLSVAEYEARVRIQEGKCLICGVQPEVLHIDHDHITHQTRGLLCGPCNTGLGGFKDNPEFLRMAIQYLRIKR